MKMVVTLSFEVNIETDRANANEIFFAVNEALKDGGSKMALMVLEGYQDRVVELLCSASGRVAKKGLGGHEVKGEEGHKCRCRTFRRAGKWSDERKLDGELFSVKFRPAMVECEGCGKRFTPVIDALELDAYQGRTDGLLRKVMEAVADTSYRRGSVQLDRIAEVPVPKSTTHRWAANVELPVMEGKGEPFLGADGTGFKRQPGEKGEVRMVLEISGSGGVRPLGVWAGTSWKNISKEVKKKLRGQPDLFISDGERGLENWLGKLADRSERCHWHLSRDSGYVLWEDGAPLDERKAIKKKLNKLLAIEIPEKDVEFVTETDKSEIIERIEAAEKELDSLKGEFEAKGYEKAATYLSNARDRLFNHLRLWLETGIVGPRTTSIIENIIRELVRRLKKVGWNWSDKGAEKMGRLVMMRRYDKDAWEEFWRKKMNLQGRCQIKLVSYEAAAIT